MNLLFFVLAAYGLTQILVYGSIFNKIRPTKEYAFGMGELFHCPMCMGFWVGLFLWAINPFTLLFTFDNSIVTGLLLGCLSSGTSYILNMLFGDNGVNFNVNN
jgi:hypothetical protein